MSLLMSLFSSRHQQLPDFEHPRTLIEMPPDGLKCIISCLIMQTLYEPVLQSLVNLSRTCKRMRKAVVQDESFVRFEKFVRCQLMTEYPRCFRMRLFTIDQFGDWCSWQESQDVLIRALGVHVQMANGAWADSGERFRIVCDRARFQSDALCMKALRWGIRLNYIRDPSMEMCARFVESNIENAGHIQTPSAELYHYILRKCHVDIFGRVSLGQRTMELQRAALKHNPENLGFIPSDQRTTELCLEAISIGGWKAAKYIPPLVFTKEMALAVINQCGDGLEYIPETLQTRDIIEIAISKTPRAVQYVKPRLPEDLGLLAVKKDPTALGFIKNPTSEMHKVAWACV